MYYMIANDELYHHGIKGQKWGVRKYQNPDGSLTSEGRRRYGFGERMANTGRKIRDYMTVKGDDGKRHLSEKGKKVVKGAAIGVGAAAAVTGAAIVGKQFLKNRKMLKGQINALDSLKKEIDEGKEQVMYYFKRNEAADKIVTEINKNRPKNPSEMVSWLDDNGKVTYISKQDYYDMNNMTRKANAELERTLSGVGLAKANSDLKASRAEWNIRNNTIEYLKKHPLSTKVKLRSGL